MSLHWTYREVSEDDLLQGDILERTDALEDVLKIYHPYFCRDVITGFLVLTQSCDLVRDKSGNCKAPYISIAVIRELEPLLPDLLGPTCGAGIENVYLDESRYAARDILRKLINQNDQSRGLFYLHPVSAIEHSLNILAFPSICLLRVSIALRRQHYSILVEARRLHLENEYANKLGWLAGNLFSRIATKDWEEQQGHAKASEEQCNRLLASISEKDDQNWIPSSWLEAAKKNGKDLTKIDPSIMRSELDAIKPPTAIESAATVITSVAEKTIANSKLQEIQARLAESTGFCEHVAEHFANVFADLINAGEVAQLKERLVQANYGSKMALVVVRQVLVEFYPQDLPADRFAETLRELTIDRETIKVLGHHLRQILNDDQLAASIKREAENKRLFSEYKTFH